MFSEGGREAPIASLVSERTMWLTSTAQESKIAPMVLPIIEKDIPLPHSLVHGSPVLMMVRLKGRRAFCDEIGGPMPR